MEIKRASVLGFCFGVRRAVEMAEEALNSNKEKVYSLGPLIHNEAFLDKLCKKGLIIIEENQLDEIPNKATVIIRAHGVAPKVITELEAKNCQILDATCPRVKASQKMVERYTSGSDYVIISGDKNHGEMVGIAGYANINFIQIQNATEAQSLKIKDSDKINVILMSQTTYSQSEFDKIQSIIKSEFKNTAVMNTICPATKERQDALRELCLQVEGILVIGGKNSANTNRLFQTAKSLCKQAVFIQSSKDIPEEFFKLKTVGITAGASTPDDIINEVEQSLKKSGDFQS